MSSYIFYAMAFLPLMWEVLMFRDPQPYLDLKAKQDKSKDEMNFLGLLGCFQGFYALWVVVGLFTSQWMFFCGLLFMTVAFPKRNATWLSIDAAISFLLIITMILNRFHFHWV